MKQTLVRSSDICYYIFNLLVVKSSGFGFNSYNYINSETISLRLRPQLKLAIQINSLDPYAKGTLSLLRALTACRFEISVLFQLHYTWILFHLSFTLLVHYRWLSIYLGLAEGTAIFKQKCTFNALLSNYLGYFSYRTITFFSYVFQRDSLRSLSNFRPTSLSLTSTSEIPRGFFSPPYWDVSLQGIVVRQNLALLYYLTVSG